MGTEFACTAPAEDGGCEQKWLGEVMVKRYGMEMAELLIYGRDSCINAVIGKYMSSQYICILDIDTGRLKQVVGSVLKQGEAVSAYEWHGRGNSCARPACIIGVYREELVVKGT